MTPLQIKLAIYAAMALILTGLYFSWEHHIESVQKEKDRAEVAERDARTAKASAELLANEKAKVEKLNNDTIARLKNAVNIYAEHSSNLNDDVANLVKRMRSADSKRSSCGQDSVPGGSNNNESGKASDREEHQRIARAAIELANMCELQINKLQVIK